MAEAIAAPLIGPDGEDRSAPAPREQTGAGRRDTMGGTPGRPPRHAARTHGGAHAHKSGHAQGRQPGAARATGLGPQKRRPGAIDRAFFERSILPRLGGWLCCWLLVVCFPSWPGWARRACLETMACDDR